MTLKDLRIESGLKAAKVAETLDISRTHLYNLENNKYRLDKLKIKALSNLYNKTEEEILKIIGGSQND
ncbi:helix-turn-helix transcriptional regulator [Clostridium celatum]|uniref:helix-turn-helix transcriptional regulator n=1 Tax=Clostridium celatum TaxID=36834 RepID=UPI0029080CCE|nr:helix-turn-helix transcriptional regulator [Clostridium celatum]MDU6296053.1 helix-turn-helix transcriptional regulator [Clostridium celatum]